MKRIALTLFAVVAILVSGAGSVTAAPPGNDGDLCHGANQETCRPDPNPNGQDCEDHGNNVDGNDDHCASEAPSSTPTPTSTPKPTDEPSPTATPTPSISPSIEPSESPTPSAQPSETPSVTPPAPSPSDSPNATPTPKPSETPSTSSSPTLKPSSKPTPERPVATPPSTDTEPASMAVADSGGWLFLLAVVFLVAGAATWRPRHR